MLASNAKQIIFFIIRTAVNFGFYKLSEFSIYNGDFDLGIAGWRSWG